MFNEFINNKVVVIVSARTEGLWEITGLLTEVDEISIKLENVEINQAMLNIQKSVFGSGIGTYKQNVKEIILNKHYIVGCYKK